MGAYFLDVAWLAQHRFALQQVPHRNILTVLVYRRRLKSQMGPPARVPHLENRCFSVQISQENRSIDAEDASRFSGGIVETIA